MTAKELHRARKRCGHTQAVIADLLGISIHAISKMECGRCKISPDKEERLRIFLGIKN
jgi:transcriptional regulator with XRE-family HTH domain